MAVTTEQLADWLKVPYERLDTATADPVVAAVNAHVAKHYRAPVEGEDASDLHLGSLMLAARYARRPDSPQGTVTFDEFTAPVSRYDPDIERVLAAYKVWRFG